jgi:hypothetical protein
MGILASFVPSSMIASLQEGLFDLSYIDDTSQTDAEGLLADGGLAIAESDAFKAWGKSLSDGFDDCMKADFAFDWSKKPEDCVDGLHPTYFFFNATNPETWGDYGTGMNVLQVQEIGGVTAKKDPRKIEADSAHWDETGKARYREHHIYGNSNRCNADCEALWPLNDILTTNIWYGIFNSIGMGDGWTIAHAAAALPTDSNPATLNAYLAATDPYPMDPHSALPLPVKTFARAYDFTMFIYTPDAPKLGAVDIAVGEYATLRQYLWDMGGTLLTQMAPAYGVPVTVTPVLIKANPAGIMGWGAMPIWIDPISSAMFTFDFVAGANPPPREVFYGAVETAYIESQMSQIYYHEGLGYLTQHYESSSGATTNTHTCTWDPDCAPDCPLEGSANCQPLAAKGYDAGKIPGLYFGSPKGAPGFPAFTWFVPTYYLVLTAKSAGRIVLPVKYKGPPPSECGGLFPSRRCTAFESEEEKHWEEHFDYKGFLIHSTFKTASFYRRLENCNYAGGRDLGNGEKDSQGIDCVGVTDTSALAPVFGLPIYWNVMIRNFVAPGWDPVLTNAGAGAGNIPISKQVTVTSCEGKRFCSDAFTSAKGPGFTIFASIGYEPHLGVLVDLSLAAGLAWKWSPSPRHMHLMSDGYKYMPLFWAWDYLHLPPAFSMDLAKLQEVPAALNGLYLLLLGQCMISLVGGVACCFCGI